MASIKVQATLTEAQGGPREIEVDYDFGDNLEHSEEMFGEEVVYNNFVAQAKISLQAKLRILMKPDNDGNSMTDDQIVNALSDWTPTAKVIQRKSKIDKGLDLMDKLSDGEKAEFLEKAKAMLAAQAAAAA